MDVNTPAGPAQAGSATGPMCALTIGSHAAEGSANGAAPLIPFGAPKLPACMRGAPSGRAPLLGSYCGAAGSFAQHSRQIRVPPAKPVAFTNNQEYRGRGTVLAEDYSGPVQPGVCNTAGRAPLPSQAATGCFARANRGSHYRLHSVTTPPPESAIGRSLSFAVREIETSGRDPHLGRSRERGRIFPLPARIPA